MEEQKKVTPTISEQPANNQRTTSEQPVNDRRTMDRTYLIFSLIFGNENTFEKCSKEECKNLLDVSCSMSLQNKNIKNALIKHKVQDLFNKSTLCVLFICVYNGLPLYIHYFLFFYFFYNFL